MNKEEQEKIKSMTVLELWRKYTPMLRSGAINPAQYRRLFKYAKQAENKADEIATMLKEEFTKDGKPPPPIEPLNYKD